MGDIGDVSHDYGKDSFDWTNYDLNRPKYPTQLFDTIFSFHISKDGGFDKALDCGCGSGNVLKRWADRFNEIHALDLQTSSIQQAMPQRNIVFHQGPAENLNFLADASVNFVGSAASAHWFDRALWLPEVARVLKPRGTLAVWSHHALPFDCDGSNELHDIYQSYFMKSLKGLTKTETPTAETSTIQGYSHGFSEGFESFEFSKDLFHDVRRIYWNRPDTYPSIPLDTGGKYDSRSDPRFMSKRIDFEGLRGYHKSLSNFEEKWLQADPAAKDIIDREWVKIRACFEKAGGTREVYWPCSLVLVTRK